jgi:hypothetical protein
MRDELGKRETPARYPKPLADERVKEIFAGAAEVCGAVVEQVRRQPDFNEKSGLIDEATLSASLDFNALCANIKAPQTRSTLRRGWMAMSLSCICAV